MRFWIIPPLAFLSFGFAPPSFIWQPHPAAGHLTGIGRLAAHPQKSHIIFFTSSGALYKADLQTDTSSLLFTFPVSDGFVYDLLVSGDKIYASVSSGVYEISETGAGQIIFQAAEDQMPCRSLAVLDGTLFIGTGRGVKYRTPQTSVWKILGGASLNRPVTGLRAEGSFLYIGVTGKIIRWNYRTQEFKDVLTVPSRFEIADSGLDSDGIPYEAAGRGAFLGFDIDGPAVILALDAAGVRQSGDAGSSWDNVSANASPPDINTIRIIRLNGRPCLAAATDQGIFYLSDGHWISIRRGMETVKVNDVIQTSAGEIVASTDRGIFILKHQKALSGGENGTGTRSAGISGPLSEFGIDPDIRKVQIMAVEYAEVHPDKISNWRKQARRRAILPDFNVGIDRDAGELLHWDTGLNPDQLTHGKELVNWDVSLSWDLGDLIWSSDQTSIDSRSKLTVELREDILNQVTRIYFERKRLQYQLAQLDDAVLRFETDLRIQELTALLDGFTGGLFSLNLAAGEE